MPKTRKRPQKQTPKYKDSDESDGDDDFHDSGSEASIPQEEDDDSFESSGEDFKEETPKTRNKSFSKNKNTTRCFSNLTKQLSKQAVSNSNPLSVPKAETEELSDVLISVKDLTDQEKQLPAFLNLSESDSDGSEDDTKGRRLSNLSNEPLDAKAFIQQQATKLLEPKTEAPDGPQPRPSLTDAVERLSGTDSNDEMEDVADGNLPKSDVKAGSPAVKKYNFEHFQLHTKKLEDAKVSCEEYTKRKSVVQQESFDVGSLLAMGEAKETKTEKKKKTVSKKSGDMSDSDIEDLEEVKEAKSLVPKGGLQLVLDLPSSGPKRKSKAEDLEMKMKRRLNLVKKQYQVFMHKVHILCWIGHGNYVNKSLNNEAVMAAALSLMPSEHCYPSDRVNIKYLEQITKWYSEAMYIQEDKNENKFKFGKQLLNLELLQQINKKKFSNKKNMVFVFVSMLRALGIKCRVVFSFKLVPLRPPDLLSVKKSEKNKEKAETSEHFKASMSGTAKSSKSVSASKKQSKSVSNILQLDGADDRDLVKSKRLSSRKKPAGKVVSPKVTSKESGAASSSSMSHWDKITQDIIETPKSGKRVSHREVSKRLNSSPAVKKEVVTPDSQSRSKSMSDQSTVVFGEGATPSRVVEIKNEIVSSPSGAKHKLYRLSSDDKSTKQSTSRDAKSVGKKPDSPSVTKQVNENGINKGVLKQSVNKKQTANAKKVNDTEESSKYFNENTAKQKAVRKSAAKKVTASEVKEKMDVPKRVTRRSSVSSGCSSMTTRSCGTPDLSEKQQKTSTAAARKRVSLAAKKKDSEKQDTISSSSRNKKELEKEDKNKKHVGKEDKNKKPVEKEDKNKKPVGKEDKNKKSQSKASSAKSSAQKNTSSPNTSKYFDANKSVDKTPTSTNKRVSHRDVKASNPGPSNEGASCSKAVRDIVELAKNRLVKNVVQSRRVSIRDKLAPEIESPESKSTKRKRKISNSSDADFKPEVKKRLSSQKSGKKSRKVLSTDSEPEEDSKRKRKGVDVWCEVYVEEEEQWISVDVIKGQVHCVHEIYARSTHPVSYIVCWDSAGYAKDVTRRYVPHWNTTTRLLRTDPSWYDDALRPWMAPASKRDVQEDKQLDRMQLDAPLPTTVGEYKNHPLYALKRHLLKFEVIYPPDSMTLGFVRNEPVFARECVHVCRSRETWVKEARVVRAGEQPYKIVKARPKWDRISNKMITDIPLEVFGPWQCDDYEPPQAENGKVPRNAYGNVELFKMCMLPKGTVHLQLPGLNKVARKLNIDCASAMTGFDYHSGWSHPVYDGFVVCEEFKDQIIEAWETEQVEAELRAREKIDKRVYGNWRRLIRGLMIREKIQARYDFQAEEAEPVPEAPVNNKRPKGPTFLAKKKRT